MHMRVGLVVTTYSRPRLAAEIIEASRTWTIRPVRLLVADNSPAGVKADAEILRWDRNIGLPAALGASFRHLDDVDAVLVLDDDTVLADNTLENMVALLVDGVGVVNLPTDACRRTQQHAGGPTRIFSWSPSVVSTEAITAVGLPRPELFLIWDDWDFGIRIVEAGWQVCHWGGAVPRQKLGDSMWPGRQYLRGRNATYLYLHAGQRDPIFREQLGNLAKEATRSPMLARGLLAGVLGRSGPPPAALMPTGT